MAPRKLKFAFVSLTSCEGCYFELLGLREKFVELKDKIEVVEFRLFADDELDDQEKIDVVFIEGSPVTTANINALEKLRAQSQLVVACGSCAHIGGIYHMKNYSQRERLMEHVYAPESNLENPEIFPVQHYIKVDFNLPGCPVTKDEILRFIYAIVDGKYPMIKQNPVCYECFLRGNECLLQKGEICLGPITVGGCQAICLTSGQACWGCRGLLRDPQIDNWITILKEKGFTQSHINEVLKVFGVKDLIEARKDN
jgi:coenzyme F420-reducing hydrogenase gamma subunit